MYNMVGGDEESVSCPHDIQYIEHLEKELDALKKENAQLKSHLRDAIRSFDLISERLSTLISKR